MEKCQREKERLYIFGADREGNKNDSCFGKVDNKQTSYYLQRNACEYLMKYDFETLPELKEKLEILWKDKPYMQDILKTVLVAAMKCKVKDIQWNTVETKNEEQNMNSSDTLPIFIYNF